MIKQWKNENLGVTYFYLPNSKNNEILTSDGVLIPYDEFKSMTSETYNAKKNTNGGYDFDLDASAFMLGANGKIPADEYFVFYNNLFCFVRAIIAFF